VAYVVLLNGVAVIALLVAFARGTSTGENIKPFADAMMVFGAGAALGLTSAFFAYLGRTFRMERPAYLAKAFALACHRCCDSGNGLLPWGIEHGANCGASKGSRLSAKRRQPSVRYELAKAN
jgi:hypothetical protein